MSHVSEQTSLPRPRQVVMAGWVGGVASVMMLATVFTRMTSLRSVDTREAIDAFLGRVSGRVVGVPLDVDQVLLLARIGLFVTGAAAAATLVLTAFATLRRDRQSRVGLTVAAVPIMLCGVFFDPFLAGFILAATVLLWTRPASDWFAGRAASAPPQSVPPMPSLPPLPRLPESGPAKPPPFGIGYGGPGAAAPPSATGAVADPEPPRPRAPRPAPVSVACAISWVASAATGLLLVLGVVVANSSGFRKQLVDQIEKSGNQPANVSIDDLVVVAQVMAVLAAVWCLAACAVAVFAFLGHGWARITLAVSAVAAAVTSVLGVVAFPGFLLITAAAVSVAVLLFRGDVSRWYEGERRRTRQGPPVRPPSGSW